MGKSDLWSSGLLCESVQDWPDDKFILVYGYLLYIIPVIYYAMLTYFFHKDE